jgi:MtN3 and saliva related transmembrane protein
MGGLQWIDYLGLFGAFLSSITFLPQVFKAWKTRSVDDISAWMLAILMGNVTTWLVYGVVKSDFAIIIANAIIMGLTLLLAWFKFSFGRARRNGAS